MNKRKSKPGDRVLVEAVVDRVGDNEVLLRYPSGNQGWVQHAHIHPLPAFVLEEVDVNCGEPAYQSIKPSEMRVGDTVLRAGIEPAKPRRVIGTHGGVWVQSGAEADAAYLYRDDDEGSGWLLISRDGMDQGKPSRMRYCDLPDGKYAVRESDGEFYNATLHWEFEIPACVRLFRVVEVK